MHSKIIYGEKFYARPFRVPDVLLLNVRKEQIEFHIIVKDRLEYALAVEQVWNPITVLDYNDDILLIGGINPIHKHNADGFFIVGEHFELAFNREPIRLTKGIKRYIIESPFDRIQTTVRENFPQAEKLLKLLGFKKEGTMVKGGYDGTNLHLYGWVR